MGTRSDTSMPGWWWTVYVPSRVPTSCAPPVAEAARICVSAVQLLRVGDTVTDAFQEWNLTLEDLDVPQPEPMPEGGDVSEG